MDSRMVKLWHSLLPQAIVVYPHWKNHGDTSGQSRKGLSFDRVNSSFRGSQSSQNRIEQNRTSRRFREGQASISILSSHFQQSRIQLVLFLHLEKGYAGQALRMNTALWHQHLPLQCGQASSYVMLVFPYKSTSFQKIRQMSTERKKKPITANSVVQDVVSCAYLELLEEEDGWDACREVRSETKPIDFLLFCSFG